MTKEANEDQYQFLTELYRNTSSSTLDSWKNHTNWLVRNATVSMCNWYGVVCAGEWVQQLKLGSNKLGGPLPNAWERVPYLEYIDLSANK